MPDIYQVAIYYYFILMGINQIKIVVKYPWKPA